MFRLLRKLEDTISYLRGTYEDNFSLKRRITAQLERIEQIMATNADVQKLLDQAIAQGKQLDKISQEVTNAEQSDIDPALFTELTNQLIQNQSKVQVLDDLHKDAADTTDDGSGQDTTDAGQGTDTVESGAGENPADQLEGQQG